MGHADHTWDKRLRDLARPTVLILDDFAMRELTPTQADDLYELIGERAGKSMVLTSNRSPVCGRCDARMSGAPDRGGHRYSCISNPAWPDAGAAQSWDSEGGNRFDPSRIEPPVWRV